MAQHHRAQIRPLRAAVLDQGSRSWRDIASVPSRLFDLEAPVFAAGSIHWKTDGGASTLIRISSFDLTKEEFAWTPCPELQDARLVDFQGVLGLLDFSRRESMDVWVMEERGRWMKEYSVQLMSMPSPPRCGVLGCGGRKIAFVHTDIWYLDPATGEMEYTSRPSSGRQRAVRGITVSLLSPVKLWNEFCQHEGSL